MQILAPAIRCREIRESDRAKVVDLLARGFPARTHDFWDRGLRRIGARDAVDEYPRYGYLLQRDDAIVGVLLLIFTAMSVNGERQVRCSVSSWYVEPEVRSHASMLALRALKHKDVTYLNVTAAPHTLPILEAQGYKRFSNGLFAAALAVADGCPRCRVDIASEDISPASGLSREEIELLLSHKAMGCLSLVVTTADGQKVPFVFLRRYYQHVVPYACLIYCRDVGDVVRLAGCLGRFMMWRGLPYTLIDADGPIPGLTGKYRPLKPKYYKGPHRPRHGDLASTELVVLGL